MRQTALIFTTLALVAAAAWPGDIRTDGQLISTEPTEPPIEVASTAKVTNLNADRLDGFDVDDFAVAGSGVGVHYANLIGLPGGEIDQDCAVNTGCFPGDAAGFPVTITVPGSYRLAGNLTTSDENTTLISVEASSVILDLRGFALIGPVTCTGHPVTSCSPTGGTGDGINVAHSLANVTVRNGSIQGMGVIGIECRGSCRLQALSVSENRAAGIQVLDFGNNAGTVDDCVAFRNGGTGIVAQKTDVRNSLSQGNASGGINLDRGNAIGNTVRSNGFLGIKATFGGVVADNTVSVSGTFGIDADRGTLVRGNHVHFSTKSGIQCEECLILDNTIYSNGEFGIDFSTSSSEGAYGRNWILGNANGAVTGSGYTDLGHNVCDGAACP